MTKPELLRLMRLLSALESALMYTDKSNTADHLYDEIGVCVGIVEREILK